MSLRNLIIVKFAIRTAHGLHYKYMYQECVTSETSSLMSSYNIV